MKLMTSQVFCPSPAPQRLKTTGRATVTGARACFWKLSRSWQRKSSPTFSCPLRSPQGMLTEFFRHFCRLPPCAVTIVGLVQCKNLLSSYPLVRDPDIVFFMTFGLDIFTSNWSTRLVLHHVFRLHGLAKISSSGIDGTCFEIEDIQAIKMQITREKVTEVNREINRFTWKRCSIFWTVEPLFSQCWGHVRPIGNHA